jgi:acyl carrier protein
MSADAVEKIASELESFIRESFQVPDGDELFTRDVNLWEEGYVDSIGIVETLGFIEQTWKLRLPEEVVFDPRFTHIAGMAVVIEERLEAR